MSTSTNEYNSNEKSVNTTSDSIIIDEHKIIYENKSPSNQGNIKKKNKSNICIKEVYEDNFIEEINKITTLIEDDYNIIGMDTEFPGTVYNLKSYTKKNIYYEAIRMNINSLKLIQVGISLRNKKGEYPSKYSYYTWQFNLKFDISKDIYSPKSIELLTNAGINFENLKKNGIDSQIFAQYLMTSGLVLNPDISWICFQGSYDFGYLLRLLLNRPLPENETKFIKLLNLYFQNYYDIRILSKDICCLQGGLNKIANRLKIDRGTCEAHQAGSDSYITIEVFMKLIKYEFINKESMMKNKNILYGIGLGQDNDMIIKYLKIDDEKIKNKDLNHTNDNINLFNNTFNGCYYENFNYMNNNNNYIFYSNNNCVNFNLICMNYYGINCFNSNLFCYENKNVNNINTKINNCMKIPQLV
jgi:CCR4-NOT transcription complex subunit 7/8